MDDNGGEAPFTSFQRHLPQWRLKHGVYFVTWRLHDRQDSLSENERDIVAAAITHFQRQRYFVLAYVVMDDHVHVVVKPDEDEPLSKILHSWKSYTAHEIQKLRGRSGSLWQEDNYTRIIRSEEELHRQLEYILGNPRKRWPDLGEYRWVEWFTQ